MKYRFMLEHRGQFPLATMCRLLRVARSGFYKWLHCPVSRRAKEDTRLLGLIRNSHEASDGIYGSPRVFLDLRELGETCGVHRVARIMRANGIRAIAALKKHRYVKGRPSIVFADRLQRDFDAREPNQAWVTDITYIRTWQGWLYLAVVIDLHSRRVVGWSMQPTLRRRSSWTRS